MVKRGAGNGRGHVVLPIPFRTNSSFFAICSIATGIERGGEQPERYYHVPGESQPAYSPNIKKGVAKSLTDAGGCRRAPFTTYHASTLIE